MGNRIVRGQLALEIGERLREAGRKVLALHQYSGDARASQLRLLDSALAAESQRLATLVRSCRAAKNSYPNFPKLRNVIADAGDQVYKIQEEVEKLQGAIQSKGDLSATGNRLLELSVELRLVQFVPADTREAASNG